MIEVRGSRSDIVKVIKGLSPTYPADLIRQLDVGEWHFIIAEVDVLVMIEEEE